MLQTHREIQEFLSKSEIHEIKTRYATILDGINGWCLGLYGPGESSLTDKQVENAMRWDDEVGQWVPDFTLKFLIWEIHLRNYLRKHNQKKFLLSKFVEYKTQHGRLFACGESEILEDLRND